MAMGKGRRQQVILTRLRLGHCGLAADLALIGKHPSGLCECGEEETVRHVLLECCRYEQERRVLFSNVLGLGEPVVSLKVLLGSAEHQLEVGRAVLRLIYTTGLGTRV